MLLKRNEETFELTANNNNNNIASLRLAKPYDALHSKHLFS